MKFKAGMYFRRYTCFKPCNVQGREVFSTAAVLLIVCNFQGRDDFRMVAVLISVRGIQCGEIFRTAVVLLIVCYSRGEIFRTVAVFISVCRRDKLLKTEYVLRCVIIQD